MPEPPSFTRASPLISVMLIVPEADAAVAWYRAALGADVLWNLGGVAALSIGGAPFLVHDDNPGNPSEAAPDDALPACVRIEVFHDDPDGFIAAAVVAGATDAREPVEHQMPWGTHRQGGFRDPFGHRWSVGDPSPLGALR